MCGRLLPGKDPRRQYDTAACKQQAWRDAHAGELRTAAPDREAQARRFDLAYRKWQAGGHLSRTEAMLLLNALVAGQLPSAAAAGDGPH